jgi:DUF1680 family protein
MLKKNTSPLSLSQVKIDDKFWQPRMELVRRVMIPYQWEALNDRIPDASPSYCMHNLKVAAGLEEGEFKGYVFQDSDLYKWLEAVAYSLKFAPDAELERTADEVIDIVAAAQQPDGYLDTYYIINGLDKRFTNVMSNHEMYVAGHLTEAAVAYYESTGKDKLLKAAMRYADCIGGIFGPEPEKLKGYPGHEILEMALVRLYRVTHESRYLELAKYFIDQRGQKPLYFDEERKKYGNKWYWDDSYFQYQYYQAGLPVREQDKAEGHAVRAVYLYSGMADVAKETGDVGLLQAVQRLWDNITQRRMYITGGIGSDGYGEAFTYDYDLPPDTAYAETCASIGLVFLARRMLENEIRAEYADVMERALYNTALAGMSVEANRFFYVNPLEVVPEGSKKSPVHSHVLPERQKWYGCACCPPNLARLMESLGNYCAGYDDKTIYLHLYIAGTYQTPFGAELQVDSELPWAGHVGINIKTADGRPFTLAMRRPGWCSGCKISVNGEAQRVEAAENGYIYIDRQWQSGDMVEVEFDMPVRVNWANPRVREAAGKVAVSRGPLVYCLEQADNGEYLSQIKLEAGTDFSLERREALGGYMAITCGAVRVQPGDTQAPLYSSKPPVYEACKLEWIPYFLWANRGVGEMSVWVRQA